MCKDRVVSRQIATILAIPVAGFVELAALFGFFAMYIVVGVIGVGLTALFYHHLEVDRTRHKLLLFRLNEQWGQ